MGNLDLGQIQPFARNSSTFRPQISRGIKKFSH
jgi:hypothetical protein